MSPAMLVAMQGRPCRSGGLAGLAHQQGQPGADASTGLVLAARCRASNTTTHAPGAGEVKDGGRGTAIRERGSRRVHGRQQAAGARESRRLTSSLRVRALDSPSGRVGMQSWTLHIIHHTPTGQDFPAPRQRCYWQVMAAVAPATEGGARALARTDAAVFMRFVPELIAFGVPRPPTRIVWARGIERSFALVC